MRTNSNIHPSFLGRKSNIVERIETFERTENFERINHIGRTSPPTDAVSPPADAATPLAKAASPPAGPWFLFSSALVDALRAASRTPDVWNRIYGPASKPSNALRSFNALRSLDELTASDAAPPPVDPGSLPTQFSSMPFGLHHGHLTYGTESTAPSEPS